MPRSSAVTGFTGTAFDGCSEAARFRRLTNLLLGAGVVYALTHVRPPQILAVDEHGTVKEVIPFSDPTMSESDMKKWASDAILRTCTANWLHYREQIGGAEENFTAAGWAGFKTEFRLEGIEQELEHEQLTMNCIPRDAPVIVRTAEVNGVAHWVVQEPSRHRLLRPRPRP